MNQITKAAPRQVAEADPAEEATFRALCNTTYPGAKPESVRLVMEYCKAAGLNPLLKVVHIVPMSVKVANQQTGRDDYVWRDVVMPGIAHYRTQAARTGQYMGKSEPEFGPATTGKWAGVDVTYPGWCKVTVFRKVGDKVAEFTAVEFWQENYASAKNGAPNSMWQKRPFGQLQKCCEAQALRMAFPELLGGDPTFEEMEGRDDVAADTMRSARVRQAATAKRGPAAQLDDFSNTVPIDLKPVREPETVDARPVHPSTDDRPAGQGQAAAPAHPVMPEHIGKADRTEQWGWFCWAVFRVAPADRQGFASQHTDLIRDVAKISPDYAAGVAKLSADAGVTVNVD